MIIGIHHIAIGVDDLDAGIAFYTNAFGFEVIQQAQFSGPNPLVEAAIGIQEPAAQMAMLKGANAHIELWQYTAPTPRDLRSEPNDRGYPHFAMEVADIETEHARLTEAGMTFVGPPVEFGDSAAVYGRDPFGNIIEIYEIRDATKAQLGNTQAYQTGAYKGQLPTQRGTLK